MELDDEAKEIVQELGAAINAAVAGSDDVARAIERLHEAGYEMELTLRLEIGLRHVGPQGAGRGDDIRLELTDDDRRTLRSMKISFDEPE